MQNENNLCVPSCVIIKLLFDGGHRLTNVTATLMKKLLSLLNFQDILDFEKGGISLQNFALFEKKNKPFNKKLLLHFPFLKRYSSFALNLFKVVHHNTLECYTLQPRHLSKFHKSEDHYQIDMLLDSNIIRQKPTSNEGHVLSILNLPRLLSSFMSMKDHHSDRYKFACKQCLKLFTERDSYRKHTKFCDAFSSGSAMKRKSHNKLINLTSIYVKKLGKYIPNVLRFNRKSLHKMIPALTMITMDLECTNETPRTDPDSYSKAPKTGLVYEQRVLGAAFVCKSLNSEYPLPAELVHPKTLFFDETITTKGKFWIKFFSMLRGTLQQIHEFETDILNRNREPPKFKDLTLSEQIKFVSSRYCELCFVKFNSFRKGADGVSYKVKKCIDHFHTKPSTTTSTTEKNKLLRFVLCSQCNCALMQSNVSPRVSKTVYIHNAIR